MKYKGESAGRISSLPRAFFVPSQSPQYASLWIPQLSLVVSQRLSYASLHLTTPSCGDSQHPCMPFSQHHVLSLQNPSLSHNSQP